MNVWGHNYEHVGNCMQPAYKYEIWFQRDPRSGSSKIQTNNYNLCIYSELDKQIITYQH